MITMFFFCFSTTITATCTVRPSATGTIVVTTTAVLSSGPVPLSLIATDANLITRSNDLQTVVTASVPSYMPGTSVVFDVTYSNIGPSDSINAAAQSTLPATTSATWICTPTGIASCPNLSGTGSLSSETLSIPFGSTVVYTVTLSVPSAFSGPLSFTAGITAAAGSDPSPGNDSVTVVLAEAASNVGGSE